MKKNSDNPNIQNPRKTKKVIFSEPLEKINYFENQSEDSDSDQENSTDQENVIEIKRMETSHNFLNDYQEGLFKEISPTNETSHKTNRLNIDTPRTSIFARFCSTLYGCFGLSSNSLNGDSLDESFYDEKQRSK